MSRIRNPNRLTALLKKKLKLITLRDNIKAIVVLLFYSVRKDGIGMNGGVSFYFKPIAPTIIIALLILSPILLFIDGARGVKGMWRDSFKRIKYSSHVFKNGESFDKWNAAKMF